MKKFFFLALMAFLWLPATTWADSHNEDPEGEHSGNVGDGHGEVGDDVWDDEQEQELGTIVPSTVQLEYQITKVPTGNFGDTDYVNGTVDLVSVYYCESGNIGALYIPHEIQVVNVTIEGTEVTTEVNLYTVTGIGNHAFNCGTTSSNTNASNATLNGTLTSVTIPYTVTSIGQYAFNSSKLQSVTIIDTEDTPSQLATIGMQAFYANHNLTSITLPSSVTDIQTWAFYSCNGLTSIVIPDGVTTIKANSFGSCSSLETVTMNGSATLAGGAFTNCTSLKSIILTGSEPSENGGSEPSSGDMPFKNDDGEAITLYVPTGSAANYLKTQWANDVTNETDVNLSWNFLTYSNGINSAACDEDGTYYATYYTDAVGEFGSDVTPYIVTEAHESGAITKEELKDYIPAGTGVLLTAKPTETLTSSIDTYYYHPYETTIGEVTTADVSKNMLYGSIEGGETTQPAASGYYYYKLSLNSDSDEYSVGFYWGASEGGAFTSGAYKAYLSVSTTDATGLSYFSFKNDEGDTTGISAVESASEAKTVKGIYTLQGVRVSDMSQKGVYIVDGKKVLVK